MFLPCYQQGASDCGYWSLRIAAEISMHRRFTKEESKMFTQFKRQCAKAGSCLSLSTVRFSSSFPDIGVHFNPISAYGGVDDEFISPATIRSMLDKGFVVVLNIQHVKFKADTLVPAPKEDGHNICCYGYDDEHLIFQDSNKYRNKCRKKMRLEYLQKGYNTLVEAGEDLEARFKVMREETYVTEMYVADTLKREEPLRKRRLRSHSS